MRPKTSNLDIEREEYRLLQIAFDQKVWSALNMIRESANFPTNAEVLRIAIRWLLFCVERMQEGEKFAVQHRDGKWSRIEMPFQISNPAEPGAIQSEP